MIPSEEWRIEGVHVGRRVLVYDRLDSTNDLALSLAHDPANDGLVIVAREQSAGRGQHGRRWLSPAGSSVLLSVLVFPPPELRRPVVLTAWAAVAISEVVLAVGEVVPALKWPNDVLASGRKVCGILLEQRQGTVAGIGLNVNQSQADFDAAGLPGATSLGICCGRDLNYRQITETVIIHLDAVLSRLANDLSAIENAWRERIGLVGRVVCVETGEGDQVGRLRELSFSTVTLDILGGGVRRIVPEMVRHIHIV